ncbi:MAG: TonB-dependent receptor, partial [Kiritimatiellales bacterium]|nr:TonB-dependent receptor [Kiritimatiellales bacterium]
MIFAVCMLAGAGVCFSETNALPVEVQSTRVTVVQPTPEIVISASRCETLLQASADMVQVVDRRDIEESHPFKTGEALEYAPGIGTSTGTGSGLPKRTVVSLNGLPPNYTLVLLDGVPLVTEHIHTGQNIEFIPPESIGSIEIMRGSASAQYGSDAIGGVVNIITRRSTDQPGGSVGMSVGSYDTYSSHFSVLSPLSDGVRISSFLNFEKSDGLPLLAPAHRIGQTGYERLNFYNRIDMDLSASTRAYLWLNGVKNEMEWRGDLTDSLLLTPVAGIVQQLNPDLSLSAQVSYSDWNADLNEERNKLLKPEAYLSWDASDAHTLMVGGDYRYNTFERVSVDAPDQYGYGLFVQDEWSAFDTLSVMTAVRYDEVEDIEGAVSPKISVLWLPVDRVGLRASVGRGFHAPTLQELYEEGYGHGGSAYRFGNPDLDPEYSTTYMVGLELEPVDALQLMVNGFYTDFKDMIVPVYQGPWVMDPTIDVWERTNIKNAEVYGADVSFRLQLSSLFRLDGGYTYSDNEDQDTGHQLPYSPGSTTYGKLVFTERIKGVDVTAFAGIRAAFNREAWNWKPVAGVPPGNPDGLTT